MNLEYKRLKIEEAWIRNKGSRDESHDCNDDF